MAVIRTVLGEIPPAELGTTLIHEHLVVDIRVPWTRPPYFDEDLETIVDPMLPHMNELKAQDIRTVVDCTPTDLGRQIPAYRAVAERTGLQIVYACGTYKESHITSWVRATSRDALADWYLAGLRAGAGFVKLGCEPGGPTTAEAHCAAAAGLASRRTGAMVACHVGMAAAANGLIDTFEAGGGDPSRFVVVHIQNEPDLAAHIALARRGAWIEYDAICARPSDLIYVDFVKRAADADLLDRVLISMDACAYIVGGDGRAQRQHRFTHLLCTFVPALRLAGFDEKEVDRLLVTNPAAALSMDGDLRA